MIDLSPRRIGTLRSDAHGFQRCRVGYGNMSVHPHKNCRMITGVRIDVLAARQLLFSPFGVVPASTDQPFARTSSLGAGGDALLHLLQGLSPNQVDVELLEAARGQMRMSIIESGHDKMPAQIDDLGLCAFELLHFLVRARGNDLSRGNSNGLDSSLRRSPGCALKFCRVRAWIDISIDKDRVSGRLLLGGRNADQENCE